MPSLVLLALLYFVDQCYATSRFFIHSTYFTTLLQLLNLRGLEYDGVEFVITALILKVFYNASGSHSLTYISKGEGMVMKINVEYCGS